MISNYVKISLTTKVSYFMDTRYPVTKNRKWKISEIFILMAEVQTYSSATAQYWIKDLNSDWLTNKKL